MRRWTVGLWQVTGYVVGHYGQGENRYSELGLDAHNFTHVPLYTGLAGSTHVRVGHPVVATGDGADRVFIQVTNVRLENSTDLFHVSLNNPTDAPITLVVASGTRTRMTPAYLTLLKVLPPGWYSSRPFISA